MRERASLKSVCVAVGSFFYAKLPGIRGQANYASLVLVQFVVLTGIRENCEGAFATKTVLFSWREGL